MVYRPVPTFWDTGMVPTAGSRYRDNTGICPKCKEHNHLIVFSTSNTSNNRLYRPIKVGYDSRACHCSSASYLVADMTIPGQPEVQFGLAASTIGLPAAPRQPENRIYRRHYAHEPLVAHYRSRIYDSIQKVDWV